MDRGLPNLYSVCVAGGKICGGVWGPRFIYGGGIVRGRRNGHCSGRYAFYWNAFLFVGDFVKLHWYGSRGGAPGVHPPICLAS